MMLCVMSVYGAWAQSVAFSTADDGNTLLINASGDLRAISSTFLPAAEMVVFTSTDGGATATSVHSGDNFTSGTYYKATGEYKTVGNVSDYFTTKPAFTTLKGDVTLYYANSSTYVKDNGYLNDHTYGKVNAGDEYNSEYTYWIDDADSSTKMWLDAEHKVSKIDNSELSAYFNTEDKQIANAGVYTLVDGNYVPAAGLEYVGGTDYYYYEATGYVAYTTEEVANFETLGYVHSESSLASFVGQITTQITSGSYETVKFVRDGSDVVITPEIVNAILFPNAAQNNSIRNLDLGETTINTFTGAFNTSTSTVLETLVLPKSPIVEEEMVLPSFLGVGYSWTTHSLRSVTVPSGYTKIGDYGFKNGDRLTEVALPNGLTCIGKHAFENCTFTTIGFPNTLETIDEYAFDNSGLTSTHENPLAFPSSLKSINAAAFHNCRQFITLDFNEGLEFIGNSAFFTDDAVATQEPTLDFPSTLKYIGPGAFVNRNYADIYFHSEIAPCCPVGPSLLPLHEYDMGAFGAETHMGFNGFIQDASERGGDNAKIGWANRENYYKSDTGYFTILHFPAGISAENAKTFKDITRQYKFALGYTGAYEDENFYYGGSVECGEEPEGSKVREFMDYPTGVNWKSEGDFHRVQPGYRDTYLGEQKIWPSQSQWMRAYTTVANGVEYNGRTPYRPTVTTEMIELMKRDNLRIYDKETTSYLPISGTGYVLNEAMANSYNSTLEGAVRAGDVIDYLDTQDAVNAYNAELPGALVAGTNNYTAEQAKAHNAALPTAISTATIKEPAVEAKDAVYYTDDEKVQINYGDYYIKSTLVWHDAVPAVIYTTWEAFAEANGVSADGIVGDYYNREQFEINYNKYINGEGGWYFPGTGIEISPAVDAHWEVTADSKVVPADNIKEPAVEAKDAVCYTQQEVDEYNADPTLNPGAVSTSDTYTLTEEEAIAANAKLPGAKKLNDPWHYYDENTANAHNAGLPDAKTDKGAGNYGTLDVVEAFGDYISKIVYQSTRRFVLADDGSYKDNYFKPEGISGHNWWTIVFPFNMTKKQVREVFGDGEHDPHVCLFSGVDRSEAAGSKEIILKFQNDVYAHNTPISAYVTDASGNHYADFYQTNPAPGDNDIVIKAFEAYMIYPTKDSKDAADFKIPNPKVEQGSPYPTVIKANTGIFNRNVAKYDKSSDHTEYRFVGSVLKQLVNPDGSFRENTIPQYSYVYAKKKNTANYQFWFYTGTASAWKPNKCLVQATAKDGGVSDSKNFFGAQTTTAKQVSLFGFDMEEDGGFSTGVEKVIIIAGEGDDAAIYNISGQKITTVQKGGIYIKNGKKFIAR